MTIASECETTKASASESCAGQDETARSESIAKNKKEIVFMVGPDYK